MNFPNKFLIILIAGLIVGLALGGMIFFFSGISGADFPGQPKLDSGLQNAAVQIGRPAPNFSAQWVNGEAFDQKIFTGQKTVLNFWATWCAPCRQEMPILQAAHEMYSAELQVIGINAGETADQIEQYIQELEIEFDIAIDRDGSAQRSYAVLALPITFFIDENGVIIAQHVGGVTETQMAGYLEILGVGVD